MATRNYTTEAYEQIKQTIEQIDSTDVNLVKEFFSDLFMRVGQFLELVSIEQYENDMQSWYEKILDSHNTTLNKVDEIFNDVDTVDFEYRDMMEEAVESIVNFRSTVNCLRDVISGKTSLADGKATADKFLAAGRNSLNGAYDTILTKMEQETLWDASLALFGDAIKLGAGYIKCRRSGNVADYINLADTILATACDLLSMGAIVLAPLGALGDALDGKMDMSYEEYLDVRFMLLSPAQELKEVNSISDLLGNLAADMDEQLAECPEDSPLYPVVKTIANVSQVASDTYEVVNIAVDAYGVVSDMKDIHDNIDGWINGKDYTIGEFVDNYEHEQFGDWKIIDSSYSDNRAILTVKDTPSGFVKKIISNWTGVPISGWNNPSKFDGNVYKTAGTLWSYAEKLIPDPVAGRSNIEELPDVFLGKFKDTSFLKDVFDFARDNLISEVS